MNVSKAKYSYLIGIDEAGRGPIAGPVAVGVFCVRSPDILRKFAGVKDSKQLSEKQREEWFLKIQRAFKDGYIHYAVSFSDSTYVDTQGIVPAIRSAMQRALQKLEGFGIVPNKSRVLLDGALKAPEYYLNQQTIIDGDAKRRIIALASICAKVLRDRRMKSLAKKHPGYGFEIHKGYGTRGHYEAIRVKGFSGIHRRSFLSNFMDKLNKVGSISNG